MLFPLKLKKLKVLLLFKIMHITNKNFGFGVCPPKFGKGLKRA